MNQLTELFEKKKRNLLSIYLTAGYPREESLAGLIYSLQKKGVDFLEIGFPFSDPLADGPVIQKTSQIAIRNGITLAGIFGQIENAREDINIPLIMMGYLNPVLKTGMETFCRMAFQAGICGIIIPDLPPEVYSKNYRKVFRKYKLHMIFLVTPETSNERIKKIDSLGSGFIYAVSSSSTTGKQNEFSNAQTIYLKRLQSLGLRNPVMTGFGIHNNKTLETAWNYSSGAIIGTAYLKALMESKDGDSAIDILYNQLGIIRPPQ